MHRTTVARLIALMTWHEGGRPGAGSSVGKQHSLKGVTTMSRRLKPWLAFASLTAGYVLSLPSTATDLQQAARALQPSTAARVTTKVESTSTLTLPGTAPRKTM